MIELTQRQTLIRQLPLFQKLTTQEARELAQLMDEVHYSADEVIVTQGDLVDFVAIIIDGTAEVTQEHNHETHLIATLTTGETIGLHDVGFFSKTGTRTATVTSVTNLSLLKITIDNINQFLQHHSHLNETMAKAAKQMLCMQLIKDAMPFTEFSIDRIQWLIQRIEEQHFAAGENIFCQNETAENCYLIYEGKINIFTTDPENKEHSIAKLGKSALFGEVALFTSAPRNASARAIEPSILLVLNKQDFLTFISREKKTNAITALMLEHARPFMNKHVIIYKRQAADGETLITLKNPDKETYYQLSQEGWFVYQQLNGEKTLQDITLVHNKKFNTSTSDFVYDLIISLVNGGFVHYTQDKKTDTPQITVISYDANSFNATTGIRYEDCFPLTTESAVTWVNVQGLHNLDLIHKLAEKYHLHPLTLEDILNLNQRAKIEEFDDYVFMSLKTLVWDSKHNKFQAEQVSLLFNQHTVLTFEENENTLFASQIQEYLHTKQGRHMRMHGTDYLIYRLLETIVDQYFLVLENIGEQIEKIEELILTVPTPHNARSIYRLKRQLLVLRKIIWPVRELISHLLQVSSELITPFSALYLRDLHDHVVQTIDTLETFRDMLSGMLDIYLSSLSNRMNEIMKVLTIISTIFIPITFIASVFGMNFVYTPVILIARWGFYTTISVMVVITIGMLIFFKRKKWI